MIYELIKKDKATVFRKLYMKRRELNGDYEDDWQEIPNKYIKSWGAVNYSVDNIIPNFFQLSSLSLEFVDIDGFFSDEIDEENSFFYKKFGIYKTLVKIEAGFVYNNIFLPADPTVFLGYIYEDVYYNQEGGFTAEVYPLVSLFEEFPSQEVSGIGVPQTAKSIIEKIRDHTDENGVLIFQKYIQNWYITSSSNRYNIATSTSLYNRTCWGFIKDLAAAENCVTYVDKNGDFYFVERDKMTSTVDYHFSGFGDDDKNYGHSILGNFSKKKSFNKVYNRVSIKFGKGSAKENYYIFNEDWVWGDSTSSFKFGVKEFKYENELILESMADDIADEIFSEFAYPKDEVSFDSKFIPNINVNNFCTVSYNEERKYVGEDLWGVFNYGSGKWGKRKGTGITSKNKTYRIIETTHNLDEFYSTFSAREVLGSFGLGENRYRVTGTITTGIVLDALNSENGYAPAEFVYKHGTFKYNEKKYGPTALYESREYADPDGYSSITWVGTGDANDIYFQWRRNSGYGWEPWTERVNAIGTNTVSISGRQVQFRWLFRSVLWSDSDNIKITSVS